MKVLHVSCFDWMGGAGKAANRLHCALQVQGVDSHMLVDVKECRDDPSIHSLTGLTGLASRAYYYIRSEVDQYPLRKYDRGNTLWSLGRVKRNILGSIKKFNPDVVHVHWTSATASIKELAELPVPVVWSMHDIGLATGGCCYPGPCTRYQYGCGCCPKLNSKDENDLTCQIYQERLNAFHESNYRFVVLSEWQKNIVKCSPIMKNNHLTVIKNGVDVDKFSASSMEAGRSELGLPADRSLIVFGAESLSNPLKGRSVLFSALKMLSLELPHREKPVLVMFGSNDEVSDELEGFEVINMGYLSSAELAKLFSSVDLAAIPSLEDNCPQVPLEAQSCGCPAVGFDGTGVAELISDTVSGRVVSFNDPCALKDGMLEILKTGGRMRKDARRYVLENFDMNYVTGKYIDLYRELM